MTRTVGANGGAEEIQAAIERFAELLDAVKQRGGLSVSKSGVSADFTIGDICGKTFTSAQMLTSGAPIVVNGSCSVSDPAEDGEYDFYLYIKVTDDGGNVIREVSSTTKVKKGGSSDLGFFENVQRCYCEAAVLKIVVAIASVSPTKKFVLHKADDKCQFFVKP